MSGAVSVVIFGKDCNRLFSAISDRERNNAYDIELFIHCSLDIVDEKATKTNEMYLGQLHTDQKYKSFGFMSNSGIRMLVVVDLNSQVKDQEVRAIFKRLHTQYCNAISNPFYNFGDQLNSKFLNEAAAQILAVE